MELFILGVQEASYALSHKAVEPDALVSIGEVRSQPVAGFYDFRGPKLRMEFDDVEADLPAHGYWGCTQAQIVGLVEFAGRLDKTGKTLVHCAAGISRSSAVAAVVLALTQDLTADEALAQLVVATNQTYKKGLRGDTFIRPNRRVLHYASLEIQRRRPGAQGDFVEAAERMFAYKSPFSLVYRKP